MDETLSFATGLKRAREAAGLRPDEVALAAKVSLSHYYAVERGEREPGYPVARRIAAALDTSADQIYGLGRKSVSGLTLAEAQHLNDINDLTLLIVRYQAMKREALSTAMTGSARQ